MIRNFTIQYFPPWYDSFLQAVGDGKGRVYRSVHARAKGKCQLCGEASRYIQPIFNLDREAKLYRLIRLIVVCESCGHMLRLSTLSEQEEEVIGYWSKLLKRPKQFIALDIDRAWTQYAQASSFLFDWGDVGILYKKPPKNFQVF